MSLYSYVVARDFGFAPNPFHGFCTLATCKSPIRRGAAIGDWILGTGSVKYNSSGKLVYAMEVNEKLTYDQYWIDERFKDKKPVMNGSLKQTYGDNIYHFNQHLNQWAQEDSHHSNENGSPNMKNLVSDTRADAVLVSTNFVYLGRNAIMIPHRLEDVVFSRRGVKKIVDTAVIERFVTWLKSQYPQPGYFGQPQLFTSFQRFNP